MNTETSAIIGKNIRKHREAHGLTREQLAEAINLDTGYLGMCERGERQLGLNKTIDVIQYLGITPNDVLPNDAKSSPERQKELVDTIVTKLEDLTEQQLVVFSRLIDAINTL
jgi:transcriptional regulator with XRE-family HTH domain